MIIADMGSGELCKNDSKIGKEMIDSIVEAIGADKLEEIKKKKLRYNGVILKYQLFKQAKDGDKELLPLMPHLFDTFYKYATEKGLMVTSSIFDPESLEILLKYEIPFVKFANNMFVYEQLIRFIPRGMPIYYSVGSMFTNNYRNRYYMPEQDIMMACVSKYPAELSEYETNFSTDKLCQAVSDHTVGLDLYGKFRPYIWEKHYKLNGMNHCADCGNHAINEKDLKGLLS